MGISINCSLFGQKRRRRQKKLTAPPEKCAILIRYIPERKAHHMRPVIGISAHPTLHDYRGNKSTIQSCGENYLFSLEAVGAVPLILPIYDDPEALDRYVGLCDGYLIPGGIDVNPISYGETPHPLLETTRLDFDEYQLHLIERMRVSKKPVLAICRGIQIVNVAYGGTLYQDVSLHGEGTMRHSQV
ncbi:MAG: gamma-glutamyl-gamma-aminobutyrate hydrolase family protein, partial [Acidaminococcaceae bacterium]|nr:gamma-glutamyl-gamma-aminobutyrate hydrolase family protein [Acidaminococcaceae bacterium]